MSPYQMMQSLFCLILAGTVSSTPQVHAPTPIMRSRTALEPEWPVRKKLQPQVQQHSSVVQNGSYTPVGSVLQPQLGGLTHSGRTHRLLNYHVCAGFLAAMLVVALLPVMKQGLGPFVMTTIYVLCLSLIKLSVKVTMQSGWPYPYALAEIHMLSTGILACALNRPRLRDAPTVFPVAVFAALSLIFNNLALMFSGVAFVSMLACSTPAITCAMEALTCRRPFTCQAWGAVALVCLGSLLCVGGEAVFSWRSCTFALLAATLRSAKTIWQHDLLISHICPGDLTAWTGIWASLIMVPLVARQEGLDAIHGLQSAPYRARVALALSTVIAAILNFVQCTALVQLGTMLQQAIGNLQLVLVMVLACASLHEVVMPTQWFGVMFLVMGALFTKGSCDDKSMKECPGSGTTTISKH
mmetsp:Transcript_26891/g.52678  ORF Transcript_26891/g.52678 Transcript_26891/m.52678 type:complete len:412 (-) Transcript_26891:64-1299(-)